MLIEHQVVVFIWLDHFGFSKICENKIAIFSDHDVFEVEIVVKNTTVLENFNDSSQLKRPFDYVFEALFVQRLFFGCKRSREADFFDATPDDVLEWSSFYGVND